MPDIDRFTHNPELPAVSDVIPHQPPHLWLDGVSEVTGGEAFGFWTPGDEHYDGHFDYTDEDPETAITILPGVIQIEATAQLGAYALLLEEPDKIPLLTSVGSRHEQPVFPGQTLGLHMVFTERERRGFVGRGEVTVDGELTTAVRIAGRLVTRRAAEKLLRPRGRQSEL